MTRDDVIRWAREAGFTVRLKEDGSVLYIENLYSTEDCEAPLARFASLVAADERARLGGSDDAYAFVSSMVERADINEPFPAWHGWALREAFAAGQAAEREACAKSRAGKPRELAPVGTGALYSEQQYCFNKGWKEGAAAVRAAIRARWTT